MYKITSNKKRIQALSGTNNSVDFHNKLFNTDDCVIEFIPDPTPEELEIKKEQYKLEQEKENKINELKNKLEEIDKKSIRAIRTSDIERIETLEKEAEEIRIELRKIS
jgi:hypothetical protein